MSKSRRPRSTNSRTPTDSWSQSCIDSPLLPSWSLRHFAHCLRPRRTTPMPSPAPVPAGAYTVDKAHTSLIFRVSHMGFSNYTGRFTRSTRSCSSIRRTSAPRSVRVSIDPRSIEADNAPDGFMQTLAGKDWLDAERFPQMTFRVEVRRGHRARQLPHPRRAHAARRDPAADRSRRTTTAVTPGIPWIRMRAWVSRRTDRCSARTSASASASRRRRTTMGVSDRVDVVFESEFPARPSPSTDSLHCDTNNCRRSPTALP